MTADRMTAQIGFRLCLARRMPCKHARGNGPVVTNEQNYMYWAKQASAGRLRIQPPSVPTKFAGAPPQRGVLPADAQPYQRLAHSLMLPIWHAAEPTPRQVQMGWDYIEEERQGKRLFAFPDVDLEAESVVFRGNYVNPSAEVLKEMLACAENGWHYFTDQTGKLRVTLHRTQMALQAALHALREVGYQRPVPSEPLVLEPMTAPMAVDAASQQQPAPGQDGTSKLGPWLLTVLEKVVGEAVRAGNEALFAQHLLREHAHMFPQCPFPGYRANSALNVRVGILRSLLRHSAPQPALWTLVEGLLEKRLKKEKVATPHFWNQGGKIATAIYQLPTTEELAACAAEGRELCPIVPAGFRSQPQLELRHTFIGRPAAVPELGYSGPPAPAQPMQVDPPVVPGPQQQEAQQQQQQPEALPPPPPLDAAAAAGKRAPEWDHVADTRALTRSKVGEWARESAQEEQLPPPDSPPAAPVADVIMQRVTQAAAQAAAQAVTAAIQQLQPSLREAESVPPVPRALGLSFGRGGGSGPGSVRESLPSSEPVVYGATCGGLPHEPGTCGSFDMALWGGDQRWGPEAPVGVHIYPNPHVFPPPPPGLAPPQSRTRNHPRPPSVIVVYGNGRYPGPMPVRVPLTSLTNQERFCLNRSILFKDPGSVLPGGAGQLSQREANVAAVSTLQGLDPIEQWWAAKREADRAQAAQGQPTGSAAPLPPHLQGQSAQQGHSSAALPPVPPSLRSPPSSGHRRAS